MQQDPNPKSKENKAPESGQQSRDTFSGMAQSLNDQASKSTTRFPPLRGNKNQQIASKGIELQPTLERKITEPEKRSGIPTQTNYMGRKFNIKRKTEKDKKKPLQQQFRPEFLQRYEQYINFLSHVNISNNLRISCEELQNPYVLYVGKGNNGSLIKAIFRNYRPWWVLEQDPQSSNINFHWYQLRQNAILDEFKEVNNSDDYQKFQYYSQEGEGDDKSRSESQTCSRSSTQRSQSLISRNTFFGKRPQVQLSKRNSSISKNENRSTEKSIKLSPNVKNHNMKELKSEACESEVDNAQKKMLSNPKMWPIYFMYRKLFSASDMKKIKKMGIIQQDGRIQGKLLRSKARCIEGRSQYLRMHNHLENNWNLSNKKALFVNIRRYFEAQKINPFEYIPMTFHVEKIGDKEFESFVQEYQRRCEQIAQDDKNNKKSQYKTAFKPKKRNAWLVKPGENTNRGNGIEVVESLQQIKQIISRDSTDGEGRPRTHIIQEYIMPFLYQKRKFDIRCYILITSVNGIQKGYWYQDGYIRTACKEFNMKNLANRMIHLTNDAVQKKCQDYGKYEPGNKLSFSDFQRYLDSTFNCVETGHKLKFWQQAYPEMKKLATDAIKSVYTKINPTKKQFSFQIFGLDFLIDENFKVWLIEANTNPCLELSSPLLGRIIPSMLENAFKIAVDPIFPPPSLLNLAKGSKKIALPDSPLEGNKFELVFDEVEEGAELKMILRNAPDVQIYNIEEQEEEELESDQQDCAND